MQSESSSESFPCQLCRRQKKRIKKEPNSPRVINYKVWERRCARKEGNGFTGEKLSDTRHKRMLSTAISAMSPYSKEESITWFHLKGTLSFALEDAKASRILSRRKDQKK